MTSQFRLYFERTLGVGCALGLLLSAPLGLVLLLLLVWRPASNLLTRQEHRQWQSCAQEAGAGLKGLLPGHIERECGAEPQRFVWQWDHSPVAPRQSPKNQP